MNTQKLPTTEIPVESLKTMSLGQSEDNEGFPTFSVADISVIDGHHMSLLVWTLSAGSAKPLQNIEALGTTTPTQKNIYQKGVSAMAKSQDSRKETKKKPAKTTKEKRAEKQAKKKG